MNSYINYTRSYSYAAVKCLTDPSGPMNEGALRPITVKAPEGSFLNPRPPAGGGPRAIICYRTFEAVIGALAPALPERVAAAASHFANPTFGGWDRARRRRFVAYELVLSGTGARATKDGCEAMAWAFNAANIPVEAQEAHQPIVVERFELIRDSAGAGKFRGGCGVRRDMRFLADEGQLTNLSDRQRFPPYGLFGGKPGTLGRTLINPGPGEQVVHGKQSRGFAYGDVISFQQPGAGGHGDPLERDPRRVLEDVLDDYVSIEAARDAYGVMITGTGLDLRVDDRPRASSARGCGDDRVHAGAGRVPPRRRPVRGRRSGAGRGGDRRARRVPVDALQAHRRARLSRPPLPRGVRRRRRGHGDLLPLCRGARARLALGRRGRGDAVADGDVLHLRAWLRGAAAEVPGPGAAGRSRGDLRPDGAQRRLGRRQHHHARRAARGPLGPQWRQDLGDQRAGGRRADRRGEDLRRARHEEHRALPPGPLHDARAHPRQEDRQDVGARLADGRESPPGPRR